MCVSTGTPLHRELPGATAAPHQTLRLGPESAGSPLGQASRACHWQVLALPVAGRARDDPGRRRLPLSDSESDMMRTDAQLEAEAGLLAGPGPRPGLGQAPASLCHHLN